jgi:hypothetical protein
MLLDQRAGQGGGQLHFDGELIRKDGRFTDAELEGSLSAGALRMT